jgi:hypothetical protein
MAVLSPVEVPPAADSSSTVTMTRNERRLNLREINTSSTHTSLASALTYYRWVYFSFSFLRRKEKKNYRYNCVKVFVTVGIDSVNLWSLVPRSVMRDTSLNTWNFPSSGLPTHGMTCPGSRTGMITACLFHASRVWFFQVIDGGKIGYDVILFRHCVADL